MTEAISDDNSVLNYLKLTEMGMDNLLNGHEEGWDEEFGEIISFHAEQFLGDDHVAGGRDGQKFSDPFNYGDEDGFDPIHATRPTWVCGRWRTPQQPVRPG